MDLTTDYLGLRLRSPLIASAGPLTGTVAGVRALARAGVGAVVLPSMFEEQILREAEQDARLREAGTDSFAEGLTYLPADDIPPGPHGYLNVLRRAAAAVDIPVIASLNGASPGGWTAYAAAMQQAGAAAVELNIYPGLSEAEASVGGREIERRHVEILAAVKAAVSIPVAVKLISHYSSPTDMAMRLDRAGADGLILFNRFVQTGIDPETLTVSAGLELSHPAESALPRAWIARLRDRVQCSLAASTGVEDYADVAAYLLAGADGVMTTSALLRHGPGYAGELLEGLVAWMRRKGFSDLSQLRGLLAGPAGGSPASGRALYLGALHGGSRTFGLDGMVARPGQTGRTVE